MREKSQLMQFGLVRSLSAPTVFCFFSPPQSSHNMAEQQQQQQQHFHTLSRLSRTSLWSIGSVLLSSGTIGAVVRKERGDEWSFPGPYKASSFLLDEVQPACSLHCLARQMHMNDQRRTFVLHTLSRLFILFICGPSLVYPLVTVKNTKGRLCSVAACLALAGSFQGIWIEIWKRKTWKNMCFFFF